MRLWTCGSWQFHILLYCWLTAGMSTTKILGRPEVANIEPPKARAIAESLEIAFHEQEDDLTKSLGSCPV